MKTKLKVSIEDSFLCGRLEGQREVLSEVEELLKNGMNGEGLKLYIKARLKTLLDTSKLSIRGK